jgi:hypothetical protein
MAAVWTAIGLVAATSLGALFYLGSRIDGLGSRIDGLAGRMDARFDRLEERFDGIQERLSSHIEHHPG